MNKLLLLSILLLITKAGFSQAGKDSVDTQGAFIYQMPMVNEHLIYADTVTLNNHNKNQLYMTARKWFFSYFKYHRPDTLSKDSDSNSAILNQAGVTFKMTTTSVSVVKYTFYLIFSIKINCTDNKYTYKIFDIYFVPKNDLFRNLSYYQHSPEYLIGIYTRKHLGMANSINMGRKKVREYLKNTDDGIRASIASLNQAMKGDKL
ncbi:DUF4468 domain-containing protein [Mucilaginibacter sp. X5P1]|uniref:DUF4468 domain-containing protein n=1 Tax=Mucilaginibacter sp. X5P1 TaxID=2723088 RepID=UPI0016196331|nr:DUF4468 domain-containing protein [Mucilaginibacter sp. X5P1]MBB6142006.1 hypothetical protein [Mucilaginibacter sp. X5P1]